MKKFIKNSFGSIICFLCVLSLSLIIVEAKAESYDSYYRFKYSVTSKTHKASGTPTVKITTSNMQGDVTDDLWVELQKKYWYGWASPGSGEDAYEEVSSVSGSSFSLKGKKSGTYRLLFGKSSALLSGRYDSNSKEWYADLTISYNK